MRFRDPKRHSLVQTKYPPLYIPIETKVREFYAKLLLSCYAAEAGFVAILGGQGELLRHIKYMSPGIYLEKGIASTKIQSVQLLRTLGNRVVSWCEEGLVILDCESYARDRVSRQVLSGLDTFFAWGQLQAESIQLKMQEAATKIVVTGNPRFDLLRPPYRSIFAATAEGLRRKYGPFLLLNTNFGIYNNFYGSDFFVTKMMQERGRILDSEHRHFLDSWREHVRRNYREFTKMVKHLSLKFPEQSIIVRPHPSENHEAWRGETRGLGNVRVIHEGSVVPWMLAADVILHHTCTTGVEAYFLDKPVVSYRPFVSEPHEPELPCLLSLSAFSENELIKTIEKVLQDGVKSMAPIRSNPKVQKRLALYLGDQDRSLACEKIVAALCDLANNTATTRLGSSSSFGQRMRWTMNDYVFVFRVALNRMIKGNKSDTAYLAQKFPGLTLAEILNGISAFNAASNRMFHVTCERVPGTRSCFLLYKTSNIHH